MIKERIEEVINQQINAELYSGYLYLSMAAYFESTNLNGFANWMHVQNLEEQSHAMKFYHYLNERGGRVKLMPIEGPKMEWKSPMEAFQDAYEHEQKVTGMINNLVEIAWAEKDHATYNMLQWFVDEQVEEEASALEIVEKLKMIGDAPGAMYMLDKEMGARVFTPPAEEE
jgi:ferritin